MLKRYQHWTKNGVEWTDWFEYEGVQYPNQLGRKLKNEYKEES